MIFVDTSVWYSADVAEDSNHRSSRQLLLSASDQLVTTDYVVDELLTLFTSRGHRDIAIRSGARFWGQKTCNLIWTTQEDVATAWNVFVTFNDKQWSFTDCVSYAVMKRLGITEAFALDDHFRQFVFLSVKP